MSILDDLKKNGLIGNQMPKQEAVLPSNPDTLDPNAASSTATPDRGVVNTPNINNGIHKSGDDDQFKTELKQKVLELHKITSEIVGMLSEH